MHSGIYVTMAAKDNIVEENHGSYNRPLEHPPALMVALALKGEPMFRMCLL
jgi:hypothetical protein